MKSEEGTQAWLTLMPVQALSVQPYVISQPVFTG